MRGTLVWLGLPDPIDTRATLERFADPEHETLCRLVHDLAEALADLDGQATARCLLEHLAAHRERFETLRGALADLFPSLAAGDLPTAVALGNKLRTVRGRVLGGRRLREASRDFRGVRWHVEKHSEEVMPDPES